MAPTRDPREAGSRPPSAESLDPVPILRSWVEQQALPFWATVGFDQRTGGFHERLGLDGAPDHSATRRVRVQARQIYVYAHAAVLGWYPPAREIALRAFESLIARYRTPDGRPGFIHAVTPGGRVADPMRDLYDHAFILFALAWLAHACRDAQITAVIDDTLAFVDDHLAAGDGTYFESLPPIEPRRQNPHMHLFEAMLALHETIGHPAALGHAAGLRKQLTGKFVDPRSGALREYFDRNWQRWPGHQGLIGEPGHHAEWSWLLRRHEALAGLAHDSLADALLTRAVATADPATGFLVDEVDAANAPLRTSWRCWPQTEVAKAWLAAHEAGRPGAKDAAKRVLRGIFEYYLAAAPTAGTWINHFDGDGQPLDAFIPASTFYHLFGAVAEAHRVLRPPTAKDREQN